MLFPVRPFEHQPSFDELTSAFDDVIAAIGGARFERLSLFTERRKTVPCTLEQIGHPMRARDILARFRRLGLRSGGYEELLGFARQYPHIQRGVQVLALDSRISIGRKVCVPCLWGNGTTRGLKAVQVEDVEVEEEYWFLAVRLDA